MAEHQNIEYKLKWQDDYLKWVCGFANASGGKLIIGIDDNGVVVGVGNYRDLLEQLPNKFRDILGIYPKITLKEKDGRHFFEIEIDQYSVPISYKGKYYLRSGSTLQELKGVALNDFLFRKVGRTWEAEIVQNTTINDLDIETIKQFKSLAIARLPYISAEKDNTVLLEKLNLIADGKLNRASILLFGNNITHHFLQAQVKIGLFTSDSEIVSNDRIEGNLFQQVERVMEILQTKYLLNNIYYEGIYRKEKLEIPSDALREAVINAIIHRTYLSNSSIQIKVTRTTLEIMNENSPFNTINIEELKTNHLSNPVNLLLANIFYKAGLIESWGRGTLKIIDECKKEGLKEPEFKLINNYFSVIFYRKINELSDRSTDEFTDEFTDNMKKIIRLIHKNPKITLNKIADEIGMSKRGIIKNTTQLKEKGILERIGTAKGGYWKLIKPDNT